MCMAGGIAAELAKLLTLHGSDFVGQLKLIASRREFHPLASDPWIGYCSTLNDNQFVTYKSDPNKKGIDFNVFTYKATSMEKQKTTGAANYAGGAVATQKYVYAGVGGGWNVGNTVYNKY